MDLVVANERLQRVKALDRHDREYLESHNIQVNAIHPNMQPFSNVCNICMRRLNPISLFPLPSPQTHIYFITLLAPPLVVVLLWQNDGTRLRLPVDLRFG